jgi:hypothetical protein
MYESDLTKFIRQFLAEHPEEVESQKQGRAIWWDKTPGERAPTPPMRHSPKAGGNEYTFEALEAEAGPVDALAEGKVEL